MSESNQPESTAADIVNELLEGGERIDDGQFTIDPAAAAAKLAAYSYADYDEWLIAVAEGLIGLGATAIAITKQSRTIRVRGLGVRLSSPELTELFTHALGRGADARTRAIGRLAIGIDMLFGGLPRVRVQLRQSEETQTIIAGVQRRTPPKLASQPGPGKGPSGLELVVAQPWFTSPVGLEQTIQKFEPAIRFCPIEIQLDRALISKRPRDRFDSVDGAGPGYRFSAGFRPGSEQESVIELCSNGVCVERIAGPGRGFGAQIEFDAPRRDLSQMKLVRDQVVAQLAEVEQVRHAALARLAQADATWTNETRPFDWPSHRVDLVLERDNRDPEPQPRDPILVLARYEQRQSARAFASVGGQSLLMGCALAFGMLCFILAVVAGSEQGNWVAFVLLGVGSCASIVPLRKSAERAVDRVLDIHNYGIRIHATVMRLESGADRKRPTNRVRWSFVDSKGTARQGLSLAWGPAAILPNPGDKIVVYYDPGQPKLSLWEKDVGARAS
jgi:hypothetical protein